MQAKQLTFKRLPIEIKEYIFGFISKEMRIISRFVCKDWNYINGRFCAKNLGSSIVCGLIESTFFDVAKWAIDHGAKYKSRKTTIAAAKSENIEMFNFLMQKGAHCDLHRILNYAALVGDIAMIKYLVDTYRAKCTYELLDKAALSGSLECVEYVLGLDRTRKYLICARKLFEKEDFIMLDRFLQGRPRCVLTNYYRLWYEVITDKQLEWLKKSQIPYYKPWSEMINIDDFYIKQ